MFNIAGQFNLKADDAHLAFLFLNARRLRALETLVAVVDFTNTSVTPLSVTTENAPYGPDRLYSCCRGKNGSK